MQRKIHYFSGLLSLISTVAIASSLAEGRGNILSTGGLPISLTPIGGYTIQTAEGYSRGVTGLQKYYDETLSVGIDLDTTIQSALQKSINQILGKQKHRLLAKEILAMVMDSHTGEIVAIASSNRYDPMHITAADIPALTPKFAEYLYEPGTVMIPFAIATVLASEEGDQLINTRINTNYEKYPVGGRFWIKDTIRYPSQTLTEILVHSSLIGTAKIVENTPSQVLHQTLTKLGFGQKSGIDLPRDLEGKIKSEERLEKKLHRVNTAFGYGMLATPLQLLRSYSAFVNDGEIATPHIGQIQVSNMTEALSEETAHRVKKMLIENVHQGTGQATQIAGLTIGGKTGTAHIAKNGKYSQSYNSSFYGFVEDAAGASYTIGILVIEPEAPRMYYASRSAVPVFKKIIQTMIAQKYLTPSETTKIIKTKQSTTPIYPTPLKNATITRAYGLLTDPVYKFKVFNDSVTLKPSEPHSPVQSIADGVVIFAGERGVLKKAVVIQHDNGLYSVYSRLSEITPEICKGARIKQGETVGSVTEKLVFMLSHNKQSVDPSSLIRF